MGPPLLLAVLPPAADSKRPLVEESSAAQPRMNHCACSTTIPPRRTTSPCDRSVCRKHATHISRTPTGRFDPPPISAAHFLGHSFGIIPAPCVLASSAFSVPHRKFEKREFLGPSQNAAARLGSSIHSLLSAPRNWRRNGDFFLMYLYVKWNSFEWLG